MKRNVSNKVLDRKMKEMLSNQSQPITSFFNVQSERAPQDLVIVKRSGDQKAIVKVQIPSLRGQENTQENLEQFQEIDESLKSGIDSLFSGKYQDINFSRLHKYVENYCIFKKSKILYDSILIPKLDEVTNNYIEILSQENQSIFDIASLINMFEFGIQNLRKIFQYLERSYIYANRIDGFSKISDIEYNLCRKKFLNQIPINGLPNDAISLLLFQIKAQINIFRCTSDDKYIEHTKSEIKEAMKTVLSFIDEIGLYDSHVLPQLIEQTSQFYSSVSNEMPFNDFLGWLSTSKEKEMELIEAGIKSSTIDSFLETINQAALVDNQDYLFGTEFHDAINYGNNEVVQELYSFFDTEELRKIFTQHLGSHFSSVCGKIANNDQNQQVSKNIGRKLIENANIFETDQKAPIIVQYIDIYNRSMRYLNDLEMDAISTNIRKTFEDYFGQKAEKIAKLLAQYFNKGKPIAPEEIRFFELLRAKDIFADSYFILLTKRVLNWKHPVDVNRERELIQEIKNVIGPNEIEQLQSLVKDIELSQIATENLKINEGPQAVTLFNSPKPTQFQAVSLKWDLMNREMFNDDIIYPQPIQHCMDQFTQSFISVKNTINSQPKLHWSSDLSTIKATIQNIKCIMTVTQALILFALYEHQSTPLLLSQLKLLTGISESTLSDNLLLLSQQGSGFLVKSANNLYEINPNSFFTVKSDEAEAFRKNKKIRFPSKESLVAHKEKEANQSYAAVAKRNRLESSIVLKMKVFKVLSHRELYNKVKAEIGYEPDIKEFEDAVSNLIKKQFLEQNNKLLKYITL